MAVTTITIMRNNDQVIKIPHMRQGIPTDPVVYRNDCTVHGTIYDPVGVAVPEFDNVSFDYVTDSDGDYEGKVTEQFAPTAGSGYILKVTAVTPDNLDYNRWFKVKVVEPWG